MQSRTQFVYVFHYCLCWCTRSLLLLHVHRVASCPPSVCADRPAFTIMSCSLASSNLRFNLRREYIRFNFKFLFFQRRLNLVFVNFVRYTRPCCVLHPRLLRVTPPPAACYTSGITPPVRVLHSGITPALHLHYTRCYTCLVPTGVTP